MKITIKPIGTIAGRSLWLAVLMLSAARLPLPAAAATTPTNTWQSLFDGQSLAGWKITDFAGHGDVKVEKQQILLSQGAALTGISWTNDLPRIDYEVVLDAQRVEGSDFFCGLTFPVNDTYCSFIVGGWGGGVVGISSVDGEDASQNETTTFANFDKGRWYRIRVRVTPQKIESWIDDKQVVDLAHPGRRISMRFGEIEASKPFGLATWVTTAAVKDVKLRRLSPPRDKKIVLLAGTKSHGPGDHEYAKGCQLLKHCLDTSPNVKGIKTEVHLDGWPANPATLEDADTILIYCDGADHNVTDHPLLREDRLDVIAKLMKRGVGLVAIHYAVIVPSRRGGDQFLDWIGGYFDYENGKAANKWFSKIETKSYTVGPATPHHLIARGLQPFELREEYYFNLRFKDSDYRSTPILTFGPDASDLTRVVAWAVDRNEGGRGFGYTGGHFHKNWEHEQVRRLILNALLWTAKIEVPEGGVKSTLPPP